MSTINTNLMANRAQAALSQSNRLASVSLQRLSTGKAINSAQDNAAGLSISNKLSAQIRGLAQAVRNVQDGAALAQTTDGALGTLTDISQRMRELAVQSANATLSGSDRASLDKEFQQMKSQIKTIVDQTRWNGVSVLNPKRAVQEALVPASVSSNLPINTSSPASGTYSLFINGQAVSVALVQNEAAATRLQKITDAVVQGTGVHGAQARANSAGGLEIYTPDGRDLSVWYDASVAGLKGASFGLGEQAAAQVSRITLTDQVADYPTVRQTSRYVEFSGHGGAGEQLSWPPSTSPSSTDGAFSMVSGILYKGDGTAATPVGTVDARLNGLNGQPLRIHFEGTFANGTFEEALGAGGKISGWTTLEQQVRLDGGSQIGGYPTPRDTALNPSGTRDAAAAAGGTFRAELISGGAAEGNQSLRLSLSGLQVGAYGVAHGPAVISDEAVSIQAGESVSFDWQAKDVDDDYDVYAYLLNVDTGATVELLNQTGTSRGWTTQTTTVASAGNYKFVFLSGTYDATGGTAAGAQLGIDNIQVSAARPPYVPTGSDISLFKSQLVYTDATAFSVSATINGTLVSSGSVTSKDAALTALASQIASKIADGSLENLALSREGDSLQLTSTRAGTAFTVSGLSETSASRTLDSTTLVPNRVNRDMIDAIVGGHAGSSGVTVYKGAPVLAANLANAHLISIQAGANQDQTVIIELPDYGVPGGELDALLWDTHPDELAQATLVAGDLLSAGGEPLAHLGTQASAGQALALFDRVIDILNGDRVALGAKISRLMSAGENLSNMHVHQSSSRSAIADTNYAAEASKMVKQQIIQQAATSVLAQANISPQSVMQLLKDL